MPTTTFEFKSSGFSETIRQYNELGQAQQKLETLVRTLAKAFEAEGQSRQSAILGARELAKAQGVTADSIQKLLVRQKELEKGAEAIANAVKKQIEIEKQAAKVHQDNEKAVEKLGFTLKGNVESFNKLNDAFRGNSVEALKAVSAYENLRNNGSSLSQTQQALGSQLGVTKEQFTVLNQELIKNKVNVDQAKQAIVLFSAAIASSVGKAFADGAKQFANFDTTIRQIGVISESTGTEGLKKLTDEIKRLGLETTKAPQDIAELAKELSKAGFNSEQTAVSLNGIVKASEATGESLSAVGDVVVKTIQQFGLTAQDSGRVADVLTKIANTTNTDVLSLGESLKFVGVTAKQNNQSLEDTVSVLGLLGDAGLQGGQGGRNLAQALQRLNIASAELSPELEGVVRGSAKMRNAFEILQTQVRNSDNTLKPLPEVIKGIKGALQNFDAGEKGVLLKAIFGDEGGRAIGAAIERTVTDIDKVSAASKNAAGTVDAASQTLTQGLGGALKLADSSLGAFATSLGETVAPAVENTVRAASLLINEYLKLPAPVQNALNLTAGFVGILAGAVAVLTAYNLAVNAGIVSSARLAVQMVASTTATAVKTIATVTATVAEVAAAIATGNFAAAQTILAPALLTSAGAATAFGAALVTVLPIVIAVAGAIAIIKVNQFVTDMVEATNTLDAAANTTTASSNEFAKLGAQLKGLNNVVKENGQLTTEQTQKARGLINITKEKIKALEEERSQLEAIKDRGTDEQKEATQGAINAINKQIDVLKNLSGELDKNISQQKVKTSQEQRSAEATKTNTDSSKEKTAALEEETQALKDAAEAQKIKDKAAFDDKETSIKRAQDDQKETRKEQADGQEKAITEKNAEALRTINERNQKVLEDKKIAFETGVLNPLKQKQEKELQGLEKAFANEQNAAKSLFEKGLRDQTAAFNKEQQNEKQAFEKGLREEQKTFDKQISAEQKGIDRKVQLAGADSPEERLKLTQDFAKEDRLAKLREQLEKPLQEKKLAFEEQINAKKIEFEEQQNVKKQTFEDEINIKKQAFEEQMNAKKIQFEEQVIQPLKDKNEKALQTTKANFEKTVIEPLKKQQAQQELLLKQQGEKAIAELKKKNQQEELAIDRKNEDEKVARQRAFEAEQRIKALDLQTKLNLLKKESDTNQLNAAKQQLEASKNQLAAANKSGGNATNPPGRKGGGSVSQGEAYTVGEVGPELFIPGVSGTILNQQQIRNNLGAMLSGFQGNVPLSSPVVQKGEFSEMVEELKTLRAIVEAREPQINVNPVINPSNGGDWEDMLRIQRAAIRSAL